MIDVRQGHSASDVQATLVLLLECDVGRGLVDADAKALQFGLDDPLVGQGFVHIQHNEDEMAGFGDGNDLSTSSASILGTFDDSRKVDDL